MKHAVKRKAKGPMSQMDRRKTMVGYMFMAPFLILFVTFTLIPIFVAMGLSLTNYNLIQKPGFVGLTNYMNLILEDDVFLTSLKNTFLFALLTGPTGYIASFLMAWLITLMRQKRLPEQFPVKAGGHSGADFVDQGRELPEVGHCDYLRVDEHGHRLPGVPGRPAEY